MPSYRMGSDISQPRAPKVQEEPKREVAKLAHVKAQRETETMTEAQKVGVRVWNLMRKTLIDNGLMESK